MRTRTLGRWIGHVVAIAALGMGATTGVSVAAGADATYVGDVSNLATESDADASTDSYEWA